MTTENYIGKKRFNVKFLQYMITKSKFIRLQRTIIHVACWKYYWIEHCENQESYFVWVSFAYLCSGWLWFWQFSKCELQIRPGGGAVIGVHPLHMYPCTLMNVSLSIERRLIKSWLIFSTQNYFFFNFWCKGGSRKLRLRLKGVVWVIL